MIHSIPRRRPETISYYNGLDGVFVFLYYVDPPKTFCLERNLAYIWFLIDGTRTYQEIHRELTPMIGKNSGEVHFILREAFAFLRNENLIHWENP